MSRRSIKRGCVIVLKEQKLTDEPNDQIERWIALLISILGTDINFFPFEFSNGIELIIFLHDSQENRYDLFQSASYDRLQKQTIRKQ